MLHGGFPRFNSPDFRHAGSLVEEAGELIQLFGVAGGVNLHAAVILIPDPAAEPDPARVLLDKPAESHTLYPAGNKPRSSLGGRLAQVFGSPSEMAWISASTADRSPLSEKGLGRSRKPFSTTYRCTT